MSIEHLPPILSIQSYCAIRMVSVCVCALYRGIKPKYRHAYLLYKHVILKSSIWVQVSGSGGTWFEWCSEQYNYNTSTNQQSHAIDDYYGWFDIVWIAVLEQTIWFTIHRRCFCHSLPLGNLMRTISRYYSQTIVTQPIYVQHELIELCP